MWRLRHPLSLRAAGFVAAVIVACWLGRGAAQSAPSSPDLAPELPPGLQWLNTDRPLSLRALRGKVVLLDFWTYGCINCLNILPDLHYLETKYARELVVISVHSAKYDNESLLDNVRQATQRYGITHPVVLDQDYQIWNAYRVPGWPTQILIDPQGRQLQGFVGENHRDRLDQLIAATVALHRRKGTLRDAPLRSSTLSTATPLTPLRYPGKVLADIASSRLFIADTNHHRLVVTDLQGHLEMVIGQGLPGAQDGPFETASFRLPQGMALAGVMLYVADTGNHLLRRVDLLRHTVETIAGSGKKATVFNVPGHGRQAALNAPWDVFRQGNDLYIAMAGMHQIWRMNLHTFDLEPFSGSSREGLLDELHADAALAQPSGLTGDGRRLYVADSEANAVRLADLAPDGMLTTLVGGGLFAFGDVDGVGKAVRLQHPLGVAYADGAVYIADTYNHKVKRLDLTSRQVRTVAGSGVAGQRDGPAAQAQFYEPGGLSAGAGRLYIADTNNHAVRILDLATQQVSTLRLQGLLRPSAAVKPGRRPPPMAAISLPEQVLPAGRPATLRIALEMPSGWQINAAAPASLEIDSQGSAIQVPTAYTKRSLQPLQAATSIPVQVAPTEAAAVVRVALAFVVCRVDKQGICALQDVAWDVPVRSRMAAGATDVVINLPYTVVPF